MLAGKELGPAAGQEWPMTGTFEEVTPQDRLVFAARALQDRKGNQSLLETRTTVTFDDLQGKTKLTIHILLTRSSETPEARFAIQGMEGGWRQSLDKFGETLSR